MVRWAEDGHEGLFYPGPDATVEHTSGAEGGRRATGAAVASFADRFEAGRRLGTHLAFLRGEEVTVLGVHRGGMPVAFEVAGALSAPLDVIVARRLTVPTPPGHVTTVGALAEDDVMVVDATAWSAAAGDHFCGDKRLAFEREVLGRTARSLRAAHPALDLTDRTAVVVDDGMRSGWTARAAVAVAAGRGSERVLVAVPVAGPPVIVAVGGGAEVVCLEAVAGPADIGRAYRRYAPVGEAEVRELLRRRQLLSFPG